jgi:hypothetical protein
MGRRGGRGRVLKASGYQPTLAAAKPRAGEHSNRTSSLNCALPPGPGKQIPSCGFGLRSRGWAAITPRYAPPCASAVPRPRRPARNRSHPGIPGLNRERRQPSAHPSRSPSSHRLTPGQRVARRVPRALASHLGRSRGEGTCPAHGAGASEPTTPIMSLLPLCRAGGDRRRWPEIAPEKARQSRPRRLCYPVMRNKCDRSTPVASARGACSWAGLADHVWAVGELLLAVSEHQVTSLSP